MYMFCLNLLDGIIVILNWIIQCVS